MAGLVCAGCIDIALLLVDITLIALLPVDIRVADCWLPRCADGTGGPVSSNWLLTFPDEEARQGLWLSAPDDEPPV